MYNLPLYLYLVGTTYFFAKFKGTTLFFFFLLLDFYSLIHSIVDNNNNSLNNFSKKIIIYYAKWYFITRYVYPSTWWLCNRQFHPSHVSLYLTIFLCIRTSYFNEWMNERRNLFPPWMEKYVFPIIIIIWNTYWHVNSRCFLVPYTGKIWWMLN